LESVLYACDHDDMVGVSAIFLKYYSDHEIVSKFCQNSSKILSKFPLSCIGRTSK